MPETTKSFIEAQLNSAHNAEWIRQMTKAGQSIEQIRDEVYHYSCIICEAMKGEKS